MSLPIGFTVLFEKLSMDLIQYSDMTFNVFNLFLKTIRDAFEFEPKFSYFYNQLHKTVFCIKAFKLFFEKI